MTFVEVAVRRSDGKGRRLAWVDGLRGAALAGMIVYHAAWDLHAYGLLTADPSVVPGWLDFGRLVAGLFLTLSGFSLALAQRQGATGLVAAKRLLRIAVAAGLVSVATWIVAPGSAIWFGILHCIVATNLIALALWRIPSLLLLAVAVAAGLAPMELAGVLGPAWAWTGLAAVEPHTLDFRPVLPWLAPVLAGLLLGRTPLADVGKHGRALPVLSSAGRHSLAIYLLHQPVLLGGFMVMFGPMPAPQSTVAILREPEQIAPFLHQCQQKCDEGGGRAAFCAATCRCVVSAVVGPSPPETTMAGALRRCTPADRVNSP